MVELGYTGGVFWVDSLSDPWGIEFGVPVRDNAGLSLGKGDLIPVV